MAWIRVTERWVWRRTLATSIAYPPGIYNVPRVAAGLAVNAGKAIRVRKAGRNVEPVELPQTDHRRERA